MCRRRADPVHGADARYGLPRFVLFGDQLFGMVKRDYIGNGTFADYVVVPDDRFIVHRPQQLDHIEAGALGLAGVTDLQCLSNLKLPDGDTVLVNGATGGVGAFVVQLAALDGLQVIATARPARRRITSARSAQAPDGAAVTTLSAASQDAEGPRTGNVHSSGDLQMLRHLADLAATGKLRVPVVDVLPFGRIDDAFTVLTTGPLGKIAVSMTS